MTLNPQQFGKDYEDGYIDGASWNVETKGSPIKVLPQGDEPGDHEYRHGFGAGMRRDEIPEHLTALRRAMDIR